MKSNFLRRGVLVLALAGVLGFVREASIAIHDGLFFRGMSAEEREVIDAGLRGVGLAGQDVAAPAGAWVLTPEQIHLVINKIPEDKRIDIPATAADVMALPKPGDVLIEAIMIERDREHFVELRRLLLEELWGAPEHREQPL